MVGACESVSFKVLVVRADSCKGLSRGGKSGEGGPRGGGVWKIAKFWERSFCSAINAISMQGSSSHKGA